MIGPVKGRIPAALALAASLVSAGTAQAQFTPEGSPYPTGNAPYNVYAADFNGDGRPDLATSEGDGQTVSLFLRQPGGGFAAEAGSPFALSGATANGAVGDFNGDGLPDLAIADILGSGVVIALRNPAGGFTREANVPLGGALGAVGAGDFNQDGRLDLAVAGYNSANVSVLLRNAANTGFTLAPNGNYAVGVQPRQFAIADFNGDLRSDIAVANAGSGSVSVLLNAGGGTFAAEPATTVGAQPNGITAGDYDGDGRTDLAVSSYAGDSVSILLRSPSGGFTPAATSPVAVGDGPVGLASGDFDGNGTLDIAAAVNGGSLDVVARGPAGFARTSSTPVAGVPTGVAVADFNGDGRGDVAVSSLTANLLTVLLGPAPAQPAPPAPQPTPTPALPAPVPNQRVNVLPISGKVLVKRRGSNTLCRAQAGRADPGRLVGRHARRPRPDRGRAQPRQGRPRRVLRRTVQADPERRPDDADADRAAELPA